MLRPPIYRDVDENWGCSASAGKTETPEEIAKRLRSEKEAKERELAERRREISALNALFEIYKINGKVQGKLDKRAELGTGMLQNDPVRFFPSDAYNARPCFVFESDEHFRDSTKTAYHITSNEHEAVFTSINLIEGKDPGRFIKIDNSYITFQLGERIYGVRLDFPYRSMPENNICLSLEDSLKDTSRLPLLISASAEFKDYHARQTILELMTQEGSYLKISLPFDIPEHAKRLIKSDEKTRN
jgi:hypothetical protein